MEKKYISIKEVSKLINLGVGAIYNLIKAGKMPSYKVGGKRLFDKEEILEWMKEHREGMPLGNMAIGDHDKAAQKGL